MSISVDVKQETASILDRLGVVGDAWTGGAMASFSPVSGEEIGALKPVSAAEAGAVIDAAHEAFKAWRLVPAPRRGDRVVVCTTDGETVAKELLPLTARAATLGSINPAYAPRTLPRRDIDWMARIQWVSQ